MLNILILRELASTQRVQTSAKDCFILHVKLIGLHSSLLKSEIRLITKVVSITELTPIK